MFSLYQQFPVLILVESSNEYGNMTGSRMEEKDITGEELILTFEKAYFSFKCESKISCEFRKKGDLEIARKNHVSLSVPSELLQQCI